MVLSKCMGIDKIIHLDKSIYSLKSKKLKNPNYLKTTSFDTVFDSTMYKPSLKKLIKACENDVTEFNHLLDSIPRDAINTTFNIKHFNNINIVHWALVTTNTKSLQSLITNNNVSKTLFNKHINVEEDDDTVLHYACRRMPSAINMLLECDFLDQHMLWHKNWDGNTPLDLALMSSVEAVKNLLDSPRVTIHMLKKFVPNIAFESFIKKECWEAFISHAKYSCDED